MTETYDRFLRQRAATGREYGEGYSRADFDGMTPDEAESAKDLLEHDAGKGDGVAVDGLATLATPGALAALYRLLGASPPPSRQHANVAIAIWTLTHDDRMQAEIAKDLATDDVDLYEWALTALVRTVDARTGPALRPSLVNVLLGTTNSVIRSEAIDGILQSFGLPTSILAPDPDVLALSRELYNATPDNIDRLLSDAAALAAKRG